MKLPESCYVQGVPFQESFSTIHCDVAIFGLSLIQLSAVSCYRFVRFSSVSPPQMLIELILLYNHEISDDLNIRRRAFAKWKSI